MGGKAKVMSYDDIIEAKAKLAAKEAVKEAAAVEGKRGRKRKGPVSDSAGAKAKKARKSEAEVAEDKTAAAGMVNYCSVLQF